MQIKITVDIENTDILKFFELFKKDLATVAKNTTVETVAEQQPKNDCADFSGVQQQEEPQTESDSTDNNSLETDLLPKALSASSVPRTCFPPPHLPTCRSRHTPQLQSA